MHTIIYLLAGVCLGIPLGWALLFLLVMNDVLPEKSKLKNDWKVM